MHLDISKFEVKDLSNPDEIRKPSKAVIEVVNHDDITFGRFNFEPGWRWSECIKPVVHTESCQLSHAGYAVSGALTVQMNDGTKKTINEGESYTIPPGHDAWVEGNSPFVGIEIVSAAKYAKS